MTPAPAVELHDVAKTYKTKRGVVDAVRGLDMSVAPGETVALLGPNGAGKSTSLDMMLGMTSPDRGSVALAQGSPRQAVEQGLVGAMLQAGALIRDVSVRELVAMVASLYPNPVGVDDTLDMAGIREIASRHTQKLSGGEAQRTRFALALASDPEILVLDEPTVGLDVETRRGFWRSMRSFAGRGRTVLFATHYLDEAETYADRVVLLARGRVVADGSTTQIRGRVGRRTIRATLPEPHPEILNRLPGVVERERRGDAVVLTCNDSDVAIRALLRSHPEARDIEITATPLEDAFLELTEVEAYAGGAPG